MRTMGQTAYHHQNNRGKKYRQEVKEFIQQQAQLGLTTKELRERCNARFPEYDFTDHKIRDFIHNNRIKRVKPERRNSVMTMEEKLYAENNINIVYDYLHKNGLDIDKWFDIVIFGYLDAIMNYHRREELKKYSITTIIWRCMRREVSNHIVHMRRKQYEVISLDTARTENNDDLNKIIPDPSALAQYHEAEVRYDMEKILYEKINHEQQKQIYLTYAGYKEKEIQDILKISEDRRKKNKTYIQLILQENGMLQLHRCNNANSLLAAAEQTQN